MRTLIAALALASALAGIGSAHAACCDVIPAAGPQPIREAPAAVFRFVAGGPLVPGELFPGPPPVFVTDSPLAPRPPQRFDVVTR